MKGSTLDRCVTSAARTLGSIAPVLGGSRLSILIFHRVHAQSDSLFPHEVDAQKFDRMMALVAKTFRVLRLDLAVKQLASRELPARALAITFDDGYADNHAVALPILQRYGLTATFFVATGFLDGGRMWNDTVIECLRLCMASEVDLCEFGFGVLPLHTSRERRTVIDKVLPFIKYKPPSERERLLRTLHGRCGYPTLPDDLMMGSGQVRALRSAGMEIGAHTVNHPILCSVDDDEAEVEITNGRTHLESIIDAPISTFAYPNGRPGRDYNARHVNMIKRLGFAAAVSTAPGVCRAGDDTYSLKRYTPWNRTPQGWHARLVMSHLLG